MKIFLISITVVSSVLLTIVILLQQGKGADLGAAFGRGASGGLFTTTGRANFLTRITSALATVFLLSALALSVFLGDSQQDGVLQELEGDAPVSAPAQEETILGSDDGGGDDELVIERAPEQTPD